MPSSVASLLTKINECQRRLEGELKSPSEGFDWKQWSEDLGEVMGDCTDRGAALTAVAVELRTLAHVANPDEVEAPTLVLDGPHDPRFGYGVVSALGGQVLVPSLAIFLEDAALSTKDIASLLPGLSIADLGLWRELAFPSDPTSARALALRWLESPARRLAWDLSVLEQDHDPARIFAAVGAPDDQRPREELASWPSIHACSPVQPISIAESDADVVRALRALDAPEWIWARSQALSALLQRAATAPTYQLNHHTGDLRDELPGRTRTAFAILTEEPLLDLEMELLRVAVTLVPDENDGAKVFAVARWLGYILVKSPFHAGDPRVLAAQLSVLRRRPEHLAPRPEDDILHPRRLMATLGFTAVRWRDFVLVIGAAKYYLSPAKELALSPMPEILVERLRLLAADDLEQREVDQEMATDALADLGDAFRRHIAPPWIARATLHRARSSWLSQIKCRTLMDALARLDERPDRYAWLTESIALAAQYLNPDVRAELAAWWARTEPSLGLPAHHLAHAASAAVEEVAREGLARLDAQVAAAENEWRPFLANTLAVEARRVKAPELERHFVRMLSGMVRDPALPRAQRERALAWWAQRLLGDRALLTAEATAQLRALVADPLVAENPRLQIALAQLGVERRPRAGGAGR